MRVATVAGLGLALAACAPHDNPAVRTTSQDVVASPVPSTPTIPIQVTPAPILEPGDRMVDGGMRPRGPDPREGLSAPVVADEPCDTPPVRPAGTKRGMLKRMH
jgi:hypothetical protein